MIKVKCSNNELAIISTLISNIERGMKMGNTIKINQKCLVRNQECKRIFEGSRICFVASPSNDELALESDIIQQKLREANVEPYIAVEEREFQKDIFCEKICSKIIESQFCIVVLNDVIDTTDNVRKPNANVYYEYGLMTAFDKKIIPIQLEGQSLAFNIQSLDTLKYTNKDFSRQIEEAIKIVLLLSEDEKEDKVSNPSYLNWVLDIMGLVKSDDRFDFRHRRSLSLGPLGFSIYNDSKDGRLFFVGIFEDDLPDKDIVLNSKILTLRIFNYCEELSRQISEIDQEIIKKPGRELLKDRLSDIEKAKTRYQESKILILKDNIPDIELIHTEYKESCQSIKFELDIEVINNEIAKDMLSK